MARKKSPSYPLRQHATGQWFVRYRGRNLYYGTDPAEAARRYADDLPEMLAGRDPRSRAKS
jgi:hypothetical protein